MLRLLLLPVAASALAAGGGFGAKKTKNKVATPEEPPEYQALRTWACAGGAKLDGVVAASGRPGLIDLVATKDFKAGKVLAKVPSDLALTLADPSSDEADHAQCGANFYKFEYDTKFPAYAATLPKEGAIDTPLGWTDAEVSALDWPELQDAIAKRRARVSEVAKATGLDEAKVRHGTELTSSRATELRLGIEGEDAFDVEEIDASAEDASKPTKALRILVPFLDVANWATAPNCRVEVRDAEKDDAYFALTALKPVKAGDIIGVSYGGASTPQLLLDYGFVPPQRLDGSA
eukprot:CAMPEP_0119291306 /NCGR_PEP_ID=MMETSP1329-20130426/42224_1 /TAXON_ID=114041 /ORGANISM="Genus nov. species nov., Strain RCC1024" /LENGTH=290 /DNA_ID=CAMNT_0007292135 /DNA_START=53 /DNA_END=922 /DNA_ORIENTATION=+